MNSHPLLASRPLRLLLRECRLQLVAYGATAIGRAALLLGSIWLIKEFLAAVLGEGAGFAETLSSSLESTTALWIIALLLILCYLGASLLNYLNNLTQQGIIRRVELGLMLQLIRHLMRLSVDFFEKRSRGDLIQAVRHDITNLRIVALATGTLLLEACVAVALAIALVHLDAELAFWILLVLPTVSLPLLWAARQARARSFTLRASGYRLFDVVLQILGGIRIIKVYRGEARESESASAIARRYFDELLGTVRLGAFSRLIMESLGGISVVAVVLLGGYRIMAGQMSWAELMAFLIAVKALHAPLNNIASNYMQMQRGSAAIERIESLLAEAPAVVQAQAPIALSSSPRRLVLDEVTMDLGRGPLFSGLNLEVTAGETIGIVGPSGAGKTTLLGLLARFYDPSQGRILIDDHDLRNLDLGDYYDHVAIVTQDPFLFSSSVLQNIRVGRPLASDDEVRAAARAAHVDDEIADLPHGYDTPIGPGEHPLSRGQAQRINLARAILKNAPLLLLDEPTSSLDAIATASVERTIEQMRRGRTTFVVAHRLESVRHADRIILLDGQGAVMVGTHEHLLGHSLLYRQMWSAQQPHGGTSTSSRLAAVSSGTVIARD